MKNTILGAIALPVYIPMLALAVHGLDKPSKFEKEQAKRAKEIAKIQADRRS